MRKKLIVLIRSEPQGAELIEALHQKRALRLESAIAGSPFGLLG
jgi:hypothetical protein